MTTYLTPAHRKRQIFAAAYKIASKGLLYEMTAADVAAVVKCSRSLVIHYFGSAQKLRNALIDHAIEKDDQVIIRQAVDALDPMVDDIDTKTVCQHGDEWDDCPVCRH